MVKQRRATRGAGPCWRSAAGPGWPGSFLFNPQEKNFPVDTCSREDRVAQPLDFQLPAFFGGPKVMPLEGPPGLGAASPTTTPADPTRQAHLGLGASVLHSGFKFSCPPPSDVNVCWLFANEAETTGDSAGLTRLFGRSIACHGVGFWADAFVDIHCAYPGVRHEFCIGQQALVTEAD